MLTATEALPQRPRRVAVAGTSGAGKTTLAARVGELLGIPHVEIDALFHGPSWTPRETFKAEVEAFIVRWAWRTHHLSAARVDAVRQQRPDLIIVRLSDAREV